MGFLRSLRRNLTKLRGKNGYYFAKIRYARYLDTLPLDDGAILLESQHGSQYNGNVFYLLRELVGGDYDGLRVYLSVRASRQARAREFLDAHGLEAVRLTVLSSDEYFRLLASAKYLVNDNTFLPFFTKREGQVYLNTWHGTPLKTLGNQSEQYANTIGNTQRNFCLADYLLAPNEFTLRRLRDDYMLPNLAADTRMVLAGYPRNEAFLDGDGRAALREAMGMDGMQAIAYMPTWRGYGGFADVQAQSYLICHLSEMDRRLGDGRIMYVNLHPIAADRIDFSVFARIRPFPAEYETYEFLNACDALVTDYSSVMFDFLLTGRPIMLFTYDLDRYLDTRGCYMRPDELGLPVAATLDELFALFARLDDARDDGTDGTDGSDEHGNGDGPGDPLRRLRRQYNAYDGATASRDLCRLLLGRPCAIPDSRIRQVPDNGLDNVLIYAGDLARNGITTSLRALLGAADRSRCNYIITLKQRFPKANLPTLLELSEAGIPYVLTLGRMNLTLAQKAAHYLFAQHAMPFALYRRIMGRAYEHEIQRLYGGMRIDGVVQFTGYEYRRIEQFEAFDCPRTIYVHNNMVEEIRRRGNQRRAVLRRAYRSYDHVALVTEDMREPTRRIAGRDGNFTVVPNAFDAAGVRARASEPLVFDDFTNSNHALDDIRAMLDRKAPRIISIGRFSPEKGHRRLVDAFRDTLERHPDALLVIVGGRSFGSGEHSFRALSAYVEESGCAGSVVLIENMANPYPLLARCDGLILPSYHEGFGLVLLEADALGLPVVSTDIPGPRGFMREHGGTLVANTADGVREGLDLLLDGRGRTLGVDYGRYNARAVAAFESLLDR